MRFVTRAVFFPPRSDKQVATHYLGFSPDASCLSYLYATLITWVIRHNQIPLEQYLGSLLLVRYCMLGTQLSRACLATKLQLKIHLPYKKTLANYQLRRQL